MRRNKSCGTNFSVKLRMKVCKINKFPIVNLDFPSQNTKQSFTMINLQILIKISTWYLVHCKQQQKAVNNWQHTSLFTLVKKVGLRLGPWTNVSYT